MEHCGLSLRGESANCAKMRGRMHVCHSWCDTARVRCEIDNSTGCVHMQSKVQIYRHHLYKFHWAFVKYFFISFTTLALFSWEMRSELWMEVTWRKTFSIIFVQLIVNIVYFIQPSMPYLLLEISCADWHEFSWVSLRTYVSTRYTRSVIFR